MTAPKRVLVGCPTYEGKRYMLNQYALAVKSFSYDSYDILIIDNSEKNDYLTELKAAGLPAIKGPHLQNPRDSLVACRNLLREHAITHHYDYFLSLEQDVIAPPETITRLLSYGKEYVTTVVMNTAIFEGKQVIVPMVSVPWEGHPGKLRPITMKEIKSASLIKINQAHLACTLISIALLKKIIFHHGGEGHGFDDVLLCQDLLKQGVTLYCDTTLRILHKPNAAFQRLERKE